MKPKFKIGDIVNFSSDIDRLIEEHIPCDNEHYRGLVRYFRNRKNIKLKILEIYDFNKCSYWYSDIKICDNFYYKIIILNEDGSLECLYWDRHFPEKMLENDLSKKIRKLLKI